MLSKLKDRLLRTASDLDELLSTNGMYQELINFVIVDQNSSATKKILLSSSEFSKSNPNNERVQKVTQALREDLIRLFGFIRICEICEMNNFEDDDNDAKERSLAELIEELNSLVGLEKVKSQVSNLISFQKIQKLRKENGLSTSKNTLHLAFTGNPGTGKTSVARIVGRIYKQIGLLSKGHFMEVSRTDLIAGYQGQTALKVKGVIEKAKGGVLFIDEAYSITENEHTDSYGRECLTELTKALEDYREDLVVIVAGYTEPMRVFFDSNPGLKSRFNNFIEFDDYDSDELFNILQSLCQQNDYQMNAEASSMIKAVIDQTLSNKEEQFANGRYIRNIFDDLIMLHAKRVASIKYPSRQELTEIIEQDVISLNTQLCQPSNSEDPEECS